MKNRKRIGSSGATAFAASPAVPISCLPFLVILVAIVSISAGCASPGEPLERKPPTPTTVADLAAEQAGNDVILTFTLPKETVDHRPLDTPTIEIYRDIEAPAKAGEKPVAPANSTLLATIPAAMTTQYTEQDHVRYADALGSSDFGSSSERVVTYMVRTRVSEKRASANSNAATLRIFPAPEAIADLKAEVTHSGLSLMWTPPDKDLAGNRPAIGGYRIYRAEETATPVESGAKKVEPRMVRVAEIDPAAVTYLDTQITFGGTYMYSVRSVSEYPGKELESPDSNAVVVVAKDTFPPAAPENLVVAAIPAQQGAAGHLELSWQISPEPDVAGYNLYRSDQSEVPGTRQNTELLLTPAFRDMNVVPGRRYFYRVTAVDRSGNESPSSTSVAGEAAPESNP
jgi:fibronectin type 3 domain-containing protein